MNALIRPAVVFLALFTFITGVCYPVLIWGFAHVVFPDRAYGSLITRHGDAVGSLLIGQPFSSPAYFWGRLSATTPVPYNAGASSGSNYGPSHPELFRRIRMRIDALRTADSTSNGPIPVDLVTASASGLDPHISIAAALYQVHRIARERHVPDTTIAALVRTSSDQYDFCVPGQPRVNVLALNIALDEHFPARGDQ